MGRSILSGMSQRVTIEVRRSENLEHRTSNRRPSRPVPPTPDHPNDPNKQASLPRTQHYLPSDLSIRIFRGPQLSTARLETRRLLAFPA
jgi:hypothetical protein